MKVARRAMTEQDEDEIGLRRSQGWTMGRIARSMGRNRAVVHHLFGRTGGMRPPARTRAADRLSLAEREEISGGVAAGRLSARHGRPVGTCAVDGDSGAAPQTADARLPGRSVRRQQRAQSKALLHELTAQLRTKRVMRKAAAASVRGQGRGQIVDAIPISDRPAEVEDRAVPGHRNGDYSPAPGIRTPSRSPSGRPGSASEQLRLTLTRDRGLEMAEHKKFTVETGVQVYFCDPKSPCSAARTRA